MTNSDKPAVIAALTIVCTEKIQYYKDCVKRTKYSGLKRMEKTDQENSKTDRRTKRFGEWSAELTGFIQGKF